MKNHKPRFSAKNALKLFLTGGILLSASMAYADGTVAVHPYWDQGSDSGLSLAAVNQQGIKPVVAFATGQVPQGTLPAGVSCVPGFAGALPAAINPDQIRAVSFGGANGTYIVDCVVSPDDLKLDPTTNLAKVQQDAQTLAGLIKGFLTNVDPITKQPLAKAMFTSPPNNLDFDVEHDQSAFENFVRFYALYYLSQDPQFKNLKVTFTLPVLPNGLNQSGDGDKFLANFESFLKTQTGGGAWLDGINLMTMDFGSPVPTALPANQPNPQVGWNKGMDMASASIAAAKAVYTKIQTFPTLATLFQPKGGATISVTPMIGQNDTSNEEFYLEDATELASDFAALPYHGEIRYWSLNRDRQCKTPFLLGNANPTGYCSNVFQDSNFVAGKTLGSFYQAFTGQKKYVRGSSNDRAALTGASIVVKQLMNGNAYTPFYYAEITPPSSGGQYYATFVAKPLGIAAEYKSNQNYLDTLKAIPSCRFLLNTPPAGGFTSTYSRVFLVNGSDPQPISTQSDDNFKLCPFAQYQFSYYTMLESSISAAGSGMWSASAVDLNTITTGVPLNKISSAQFSGPVADFNTDQTGSSGVFFYMDAIPDWGTPRAQITIGGKTTSFTSGQYLYFYPNPQVGQQYTISAAFAPNFDSFQKLKQSTIAKMPIAPSSLLFSITPNPIDVQGQTANIGFVGAPASVTPPNTQLSFVQRVGNSIQLQWGHLSTALSKQDSANASFTVTVKNASTGAVVYTHAGIKDDTSNDMNTLLIPLGSTQGTQIPWGGQYTYAVSLVGLTSPKWTFANGDQYAGSFTLPINVTDQFNPTTPTIKSPWTGAAIGWGYDIMYHTGSKVVPWTPDTEMTFTTPMLTSVYGAKQVASHDCGDPNSNHDNGFKVSGTWLGDDGNKSKKQSGNVSMTNSYTEINGSPYCTADLVVSPPGGVSAFPAENYWTTRVTVTAANDSSWSTDQTTLQKAISSTAFVSQPYGSNVFNCSLHFAVPAGQSTMYNIPVKGQPVSPPDELNKYSIFIPYGSKTPVYLNYTYPTSGGPSGSGDFACKMSGVFSIQTSGPITADSHGTATVIGSAISSNDSPANISLSGTYSSPTVPCGTTLLEDSLNNVANPDVAPFKACLSSTPNDGSVNPCAGSNVLAQCKVTYTEVPVTPSP